MKKSNYSDANNAIVEPTCTKVYYTSRTHSQLSQVMHELGKLNIKLSPASVVNMHGMPATLKQSPSNPHSAKRQISLSDDDELDEPQSVVPEVDIRTVSLGSRRQLCINEKLKSRNGDLDEACRTLLSGNNTVTLKALNDLSILA